MSIVRNGIPGITETLGGKRYPRPETHLRSAPVGRGSTSPHGNGRDVTWPDRTGHLCSEASAKKYELPHRPGLARRSWGGGGDAGF